eukprot:TRINITY_DN64768_c0_g1_i1.p1 TRINITY_DN64768_c0_g1~~TRINITY_DN64768_c0_g1_i1.p1  ORF type:complete len:343 (+),score=40.62 TRINITY_DN64768_c0_g1_i1:54-1031(+)
MPIPASAAGRCLADVLTYIDTRWIISYAAGIGDNKPEYMDSRKEAAEIRPTNDFHQKGLQGGGVFAHPLFVWAVEWPIMWKGLGPVYLPNASKGEQGLLPEEHGRAVHFSEDIIINRPIYAGEMLTTKTRVVSCQKKSKGTLTVIRFDHFDATGQLVCSTWNGGYNIGVWLDGETSIVGNLLPPPPPPLPKTADVASPLLSIDLPVSAVEAIVYAECSRIWNPIHTDRAAATAVGFPDIILHGTCTLAKVVSALVEQYVAGDPARVKRVVVGAFTGIVLMPSIITLRVLAVSQTVIHFDVLNQQHQHVIREGVLVFSPSNATSRL